MVRDVGYPKCVLTTPRFHDVAISLLVHPVNNWRAIASKKTDLLSRVVRPGGTDDAGEQRSRLDRVNDLKALVANGGGRAEFRLRDVLDSDRRRGIRAASIGRLHDSRSRSGRWLDHPHGARHDRVSGKPYLLDTRPDCVDEGRMCAIGGCVVTMADESRCPQMAVCHDSATRRTRLP